MREFVKLSDLAILITKGSTPTTYGYSFKNEGIPFIKAEALNGEVSLDIKGFSYVDEETHNFLKRSKIYPNDILMTIAGANIGKVGFVRDNIIEANTNQAVAIIRLNEKKGCSQFYYYYFKQNSFFKFVQSLNAQAAQPNINLKMIGDFPVPRLDLNTQRKVLELLGNIDDLYICHQDRIFKLDKVISNIYTDWFINFKFPNHEQVNFVEGIPEGWIKKSIFDSYEILSGGTPKTTNPQYWDNGKIPFFTPKDATDSYFVNATEKYITEEGLSKCNSKLYDEKTIFITARGTVGKTAIPMRPMAMNQSCYALKPKASLYFYYSFLNIEDAINKIKQNANGGVFDAIVVDTFKQIDVLVPDKQIQLQFENLVQPMFEQIKNLLKQNEHLLELKHTLLPRLMSGELDVSKLSSIE